MRILLLSWEYPPRLVGGLGRHVHRLSIELARLGHEVHVVAPGEEGAAPEEDVDGVHVMRAPHPPPPIDFHAELVPWTQQLNASLLPAAARLLRRTEIDVVHAHDWLVTYAAAGLRHAFEVPLVATIHATEYGRHQGRLPGEMNKLIHQIEWWLTFESRRVITCSQYMRDEARRIFLLPPEKQDVVPNGVDLTDFDPPDGVEAFRATRVRPGEKMLFYAGRLEYEKGVQTVLDALPRVLTREPIRFYVAGWGTHGEALRARAATLGLSDRVHFLGFVPQEELAMFYAAADLAVVPSLYEPFGIVALETMASGTPCIAADTGGLREFVVHEATGLRFSPGDPASLAAMIERLTSDRRLAHRLTVDARRMIEAGFAWSHVAERTVEVYERAIEQEDELQGRTSLRSMIGRSPLLREEATG